MRGPMTATADPTHDQRHDWRDDLLTFFGPKSFSAGCDDLVASLIRHHAPSRMPWHLSVLPQGRRFDILRELPAELGDDATDAVGVRPS